MKQIHLCINIKQALTYQDKKLKQMFKGEPHEIRNALVAELRKGYDYLPFDGCENRLPDGSCAGHEIEEVKAQLEREARI